jgi:hypothetical protein
MHASEQRKVEPRGAPSLAGLGWTGLLGSYPTGTQPPTPRQCQQSAVRSVETEKSIMQAAQQAGWLAGRLAGCGIKTRGSSVQASSFPTSPYLYYSSPPPSPLHAAGRRRRPPVSCSLCKSSRLMLLHVTHHPSLPCHSCPIITAAGVLSIVTDCRRNVDDPRSSLHQLPQYNLYKTSSPAVPTVSGSRELCVCVHLPASAALGPAWLAGLMDPNTGDHLRRVQT